MVAGHAPVRPAALQIVDDAGFEALGAPSAAAAIKILESRTDIRLVFTVLEMPGTMDGLMLVLYVRERWPPIHLIIASGKAILKESELPAGVTFFSKPYDEASIVQQMREMLGWAPSA